MGAAHPHGVSTDSSLAMPRPGFSSWPQLARGRLVPEKGLSPGLAMGPVSDTGKGTTKARLWRLLWTLYIGFCLSMYILELGG